MNLLLAFCFFCSLSAFASTPPELLYKKNGKFVSLGSFSSGSFCAGEIPIESSVVTIYCRTVSDIGPSGKNSTDNMLPPKLYGVYPCANGKIQGIAKIEGCGGYKGEETYDDGLKSGASKYYYPSGKVKSEAQY